MILNLSIFHFEVKEDKYTADKLAKRNFEEAMAQVDNVKDEHYKDTTLILKIMRDNMAFWNQK